jgi:hypothetical protein
MAGIYIIIGKAEKERIVSASTRLQFFDEQSELICDKGFSAAWVSHDDPALFGPAYHTESGVRVVTSGRVAWDESEWKRAESLRGYEGGLSNRILLEAYLSGGAAALERHNGAAVVVVWDPRNQRVILFTDHFGYHPAFLYEPEKVEGTVISTFADTIAQDPALRVTSDDLSMAELLSAWRITPPHTYYNEIKYVGAAAKCHWNLAAKSFERTTYWEPFQDEPYPDLETAADELARAVKESIRIRTLPRLCPTVVFTSGGMDSRAILFSAAWKEGVTGFNMYDRENNESSIAKLLCNSSGVKYHGYARNRDYYPLWHNESARLSGAVISTEDSHYLGVRDQIVGEIKARTVMTGCTTDWLFKGYGLDKTHQRMLGRNLPLLKYLDKPVSAFLPNLPLDLNSGIQQKVEERRAAVFVSAPEQFLNDRDRLLVEDCRIRPICYAPSVSGQIMYRIYPYDTFLADRGVADCYSRIRAEWKLNSDVWAVAVRKICVGGEAIHDANFGWKVGSSKSAKFLAFAQGWIKRKLAKPKGPQELQLETEGSWPNLGWYILHSKSLGQLWNEVPNEHRAKIVQLMGSDPWQTSLIDWSKRANDFFRILTVASHLRDAQATQYHE